MLVRSFVHNGMEHLQRQWFLCISISSASLYISFTVENMNQACMLPCMHHIGGPYACIRLV
jgi:hypothetical protein